MGLKSETTVTPITTGASSARKPLLMGSRPVNSMLKIPGPPTAIEGSRMKVAFGCDHAGWPLRERILAELRTRAVEVVDCGSAESGARRRLPGRRGCRWTRRRVGRRRAGSPGLRQWRGRRASRQASLPGSGAPSVTITFSARQGVEDDDMNVLALGARVIGPELAADLLRAFLDARFSGAERHRRRLQKIAELERERH